MREGFRNNASFATPAMDQMLETGAERVNAGKLSETPSRAFKASKHSNQTLNHEPVGPSGYRRRPCGHGNQPSIKYQTLHQEANTNAREQTFHIH